jgi:two-component system NtrC family sensor kinase
MRRRSKAGGKSSNARRRKTGARKSRITPKAVHPRRSSAARDETKVARLTRELKESLEQQTATSEVLQVISSSPGELEPVFEAMLEKAVRICDAKFGNIYRRDGGVFRLFATINTPPALAEHRKRIPIRSDPKTLFGRMVVTKAAVHIADYTVDPLYIERVPETVASVELGGVRTVLVVPMLKENELVGAFTVYRQEVRPFTDKQIELVQSFASQAVIAIENTRLLTELRHRTDDLGRSVNELRALGEVSQAVNSTLDLQTVLSTIVAKAVQLSGTEAGAIYVFDNLRREFHLRATYGMDQELIDSLARQRISLDEPNVAQALAQGEPVQVADLREGAPSAASEVIQRAGFRALLVAPLLRGEEIVGMLVVRRRTPGAFQQNTVDLVKTFAAQSVLAIQNARLFRELRQRSDDLSESLQQQTATSDVLGVISRSKFELQPILQSVVDTAARLCRAEAAAISRLESGLYRFAAGYSLDPAYLEIERQTPISPGPGTVVGRAAWSRKVARIDDAWSDPLYEKKEDAKIGAVRSMIGVPLLREGEPIGVIALARNRVEPFTDREIELVTTFADQAVIAIENVRLFEAEQQRMRELGKSLEDLRTAQDRLVQTQKLASLGQLTAGIAHEIKNPLNFVNNFSAVSTELIDELRETLGKVKADGNTLAEIAELTNTLRDNLDKIVQHGKRADSIVKNMLLHSREGSGEHRPIDVNALVEDSLNLAYHGARAEKQGFKINLERSFDPAAGQVDVFPQEITRALLNLISNGFYAASKRKEQNDSEGYEPTLTASTKNLGDRVEIRIRDNGTGIPPEAREKMFNPFFTTKPAGEGTGLGLSITHDIIVKQHSGSIEVDTQPGEYTEVRIVLPRAPG